MPNRWVIVITGRDDPMWPFLQAACSMEERAALRLFATDDPRACKCTYEPGVANAKFILDGQEIGGSDVQGIWFRRVPAPDLAHLGGDIERYCQTEHLAFVEGLAEAIPNASWVSDPAATRRARSKALQLRLAKSLGFQVPGTWFTNDPETMLNQVKASQTVYKSIVSPRVPVDPGLYATTFTTLLREEHLKQADGMLSCPAIVQEFQEKEADLRITIFGKQLFAVRIESQLGERSRVDFRAGAKRLPHIACELPPDVRERCLKLVASLGLQYGAIDLALMQDQSYVFFEVNAAGQWGWLEEKTGLPMRRALLNVLFGVDGRPLAAGEAVDGKE